MDPVTVALTALISSVVKQPTEAALKALLERVQGLFAGQSPEAARALAAAVEASGELTEAQMASLEAAIAAHPELRAALTELLPAPDEPPPHNLPQFAAPVDRFFGREPQLQQLGELLASKGRVAVVAIAGMGGIGKTELALQYALRNLQQYSGGICWVLAQGDVSSEIVSLAREFHGLEVPQELPEQKRPRWCWQNWPPGKTLVVYDDVANYAAMQAWLPPPKKQFDVILTSRLQEHVNLTRLDLDVLVPEAALQLLAKLAGAERVAAEPEAAARLCEQLGYLPLGLELAGSYLARRPDWDIAQVLAELGAVGVRAKALQAAVGSAKATPGVAAAFELSWERLSQEGQLLLARLGLFAGAPFRWEWVGADEEGEWRDAELLPQYLVQRASRGVYRLHPLLREYLQVKIAELPEKEEITADFARKLVEVARQIPQAVTLEIVAEVRDAVPHIREVVAKHLAVTSEEDLLGAHTRLMFFYNGQGLYEIAQELAVLCLENVRDRVGTQHDAYATALTWRGFLYEAQGKYEAAQPLLEQALELFGKILGTEHPDYAQSLNNLAVFHANRGDFEIALPLMQQAVEIRRARLGDEHPDTQGSMSGLQAMQQDLDAARSLPEPPATGKLLGRVWQWLRRK